VKFIREQAVGRRAFKEILIEFLHPHATINSACLAGGISLEVDRQGRKKTHQAWNSGCA
jgi:hypothetical protein